MNNLQSTEAAKSANSSPDAGAQTAQNQTSETTNSKTESEASPSQDPVAEQNDNNASTDEVASNQAASEQENAENPSGIVITDAENAILGIDAPKSEAAEDALSQDSPAVQEPDLPVIALPPVVALEAAPVLNADPTPMTLTATKTWVNAPADKPDIWFQLIRINADGTQTKIGSPRLVENDSVTWNSADADVDPNEFIPTDATGYEYVYKVEEVDDQGVDYLPAGFTKVEDGLSVTNTFHEPDPTNIVSLRFEKTWQNVPALKSPPTINVQVKAGDTVYSCTKLTYPNTVLEWKNLPKYDVDGNIIEYTIEEKPIPDYDEGMPVVTESAIQNVVCEPSQYQVDWSLQNPNFVITRLTKNGGFVIWTLDNVPEAQRISFLRNVIEASKPDNFFQPLKDLESYLNSGGDYWLWYEGASVHEDVSPEESTYGAINIDITFADDGSVATSSLNFQGKSTWTHFAIGGFSSRLVQIANTYNPSLINIPVHKTWDDSNDQDGVRPASITVELFADGVNTGQTVVLSPTYNWSAVFSGLHEFNDDGTPIVYTIAEVVVGSGYTSTITSSTAGYEITNTRAPETIDISGTKTWNDADNQDGKRPESITVRLLANGTVVDTRTVTAADNWSWTFTGLDKYENGTLISYTLLEDAIPEYSTTITGYDITNSYTPGKTSVEVVKAWHDANNQDGVRPQSVTVELLADGAATGQTVVLTAANNWTGTFDELDEYSNGTPIVYTIDEVTVGSGYTTTITGDATQGFEVTNTRAPETVDISGAKTWDDANNQDGMRPASVTVHLLANGVGVASQTVYAAENWTWTFTGMDKYDNGELIAYTVIEDAVPEYSTTVDGFNITNTHTPGKTSVSVVKAWQDANNQDGVRPQSVTVRLLADGADTGKTVTLSATNNWTGSFTDLDEYSNGTKIVYSIAEIAVGSGYTTSITGDAAGGFTVTNSRTPETIDISGAKTWDDANNQDGKRPDSIVIQLLANGVQVDTKTVTAAENWSWTFSGLDKYENGQLITYSILEDAIPEYSTTINGYDVTNSYTPGKTSVEVVKAWADADNQDGVRPESVTVRLLADGADTGKTLTLTATNNWTGTFTELDEYSNGVKIVYTIAELAVGNGYVSTISGDATNGFEVTNAREPEKVDIAGTKTWDDANNQDGMRPTSIVIHLLANGVEVDSKTVTEADGWAWSFAGMDKFQNGELITYSILEDAIPEYSTTVTGYDVTNAHTPGKTSVSVAKAWADANNQDGVRPDAVTIQLLADGTDTGKTLMLTAANNWMGTFSDLDEYSNGTKIVYTIAELDIGNGYTSTITGDATSGFTVTNARTPEVISVAGAKTWDDDNNRDGKRPDTITIRLLADGVEVDSRVVTATSWAWNFTGLPKFANGTLINYTIMEDAVPEYSTTINGFDISNAYTPGKTSVQVVKAWQDGDNQDGVRPTDITVQLLANGADTGKTLTLNADNNWTGSFTDLYEFESGVKIVYTIAEVTVGNGYTSVVSGDATTGFVVTNARTPELIAVSGAKTWDDNNNQDGMRPSSITINLLADGAKVDSKTVSAEDEWKWTFGGLPKFKAGALIAYTIMEEAVPEYSATISGFDVTNTHTPGKRSIEVVKAWKDGDDKDGLRPGSVTIKLFADSVDTSMTLTLDQSNNWTGTFTDLDKFKEGKEIVYSIQEVAVDGYTSTITGNVAEGFVVTNFHQPAEPAIEIPKTGDTSRFLPWLLLMLSATGGLILILRRTE